jgi:hypothetical protein
MDCDMNFFKKKRRITVSFTEQEIHDASEDIGRKLATLPVFERGMELRFDLSGIQDISTNKMASVLAHAKRIRASGVTTSLQANDRLLKAFRALKIAGMFDEISGGDGNVD